MDDATSLDALLPSPQGPQSVPPVIPMPSTPTPGHAAMAPSFRPSLPAMRWMASNSTLYIAFFLAAVIISLSTPRNLLLQYVPNAYTSGGVGSHPTHRREAGAKTGSHCSMPGGGGAWHGNDRGHRLRTLRARQQCIK